MKKRASMSPIECVACRRDPTPGTGRYGRYGNRAMVCKYCRSRVRACITNNRSIDVLINNIKQQREIRCKSN